MQPAALGAGMGRLRERPLGELWRIWRQVGLALLGRGWDEVRVWHDRARDRRMMRLLGERDLRDMGITRQQAEFEIDKPFWRS
jgi:uncharacterized protein YjiS (DUF1127 family)